jgi:hypothetical protein
MLSTYKAILHGDRLEWSGEEPEKIPADHGVEVFVTILDETISSRGERSRGKAMAASLELLAQAGGPKEIRDPLQWEREMRADRPLPGREP